MAAFLSRTVDGISKRGGRRAASAAASAVFPFTEKAVGNEISGLVSGLLDLRLLSFYPSTPHLRMNSPRARGRRRGRGSFGAGDQPTPYPPGASLDRVRLYSSAGRADSEALCRCGPEGGPRTPPPRPFHDACNPRHQPTPPSARPLTRLDSDEHPATCQASPWKPRPQRA